MDKHRALIVDDEPDIRELLTLTLQRMGLVVDTAANLGQAREALAGASYDLCFTDMRLPDGNGQDLIALIHERYPETPVAMITAFGNVDAAVNSLKAGAFDFVSKPVDLGVLRNLVQTALRLKGERASQPSRDGETCRMLGKSQAMNSVRQTIQKLARSQAPVYISGESGVGKELAARLIHDLSPRASGPFVPVNCGAIPSELMESEFFGHRKGSFTGASADKDGLFQVASGGTLFLDEVAELPLHMQVKLLRVIQEKAVRPIGARQESPVDVRILSATHKNLAQLVAKGDFRQDLYYRINVIELRMPPLRERVEDIPLLISHFLAQIAAAHGVENPRLSREALEALLRYPFPGNVRELENVLEGAVALCEDGIIRDADLRLAPAAIDLLPDTRASEAPGHGNGGLPGDLEEFIGNIERDTIIKALEECRYNKTKAAQKLGITFRALRYRLKKLEIE